MTPSRHSVETVPTNRDRDRYRYVDLYGYETSTRPVLLHGPRLCRAIGLGGQALHCASRKGLVKRAAFTTSPNSKQSQR